MSKGGGRLRADGRKAGIIRPVKIVKDYLRYPEGSVLISCGNTKVICAASVLEEVPKFLRNEERGWVTAEYGMLPGSTHERMDREISKGRASGRTLEIQRLIGRSLRAVVDMKKLGKRTIQLDCDVIQADGGTRTASITGAYVALALAVGRLMKKGALKENPLRDTVAGISAGIVSGKKLLDLCYSEDSTADVDMNIIMTGSGRYIEVQGTAEREPYTKEDLDALLKLGASGVRELTTLQKKVLKSWK